MCAKAGRNDADRPDHGRGVRINLIRRRRQPIAARRRHIFDECDHRDFFFLGQASDTCPNQGRLHWAAARRVHFQCHGGRLAACECLFDHRRKRLIIQRAATAACDDPLKPYDGHRRVRFDKWDPAFHLSPCRMRDHDKQGCGPNEFTCMPSLTDAPAGFEDPPDRSKAKRREAANGQERHDNRHVCHAKEGPAETRDQINNRIEHRNGLPNGGQHRDGVERSTQKDERCHDQERNKLQLLKIPRPDADDEPKEGEAHAGQNQKGDHRQRVRDLDIYKEERGDQDDDTDEHRLGRGGPDIAHHDLQKVDGGGQKLIDRADEFRKIDAERGV
mmetsp:Transcript_22584/g.36841  ORF Transcript_22584/g.36841 Transcript_22584/m.36841 type:complete len:331 (+) Transcript_22584:3564-4556(+)